jgi:hypothetical protein
MESAVAEEPPMTATTAAIASPYRWTFYRVGGVDQVALRSGDDLMHLHELDPKLWIALSMPTRGVAIDARTLDLLDTDKDGHVRHPEVLAALAWIREVYKDPARLFEGGDTIPLDALHSGPVLAAAKRLLANLGKPDAKAVSLADAASAEQAVTGTLFNGDGVIPAEAADGALRQVIEDIIATHGSVADRSGKPGIDQPRIDGFFAEAKALVAWQARADAQVLPLGDATPAAADAVRAVRSKLDDYFTRARLAGFDPRAVFALNPSDAELAALSALELSATSEPIARLPIARIEARAALPLTTGVNPAWQARLSTLASAAVTPLIGPHTAISDTDWQAVLDKLAAYEAWLADKPPGSVEPLGFNRVRQLVAGDHEAALTTLIAQDLAVKPELDRVVDVEQLCRYQRDLATLLHNYVNFSEFYSRKRAVFQAGTLYLDGRGCQLVVEVADLAKHGAMAPLAGTYLAYCDCVRPGAKQTIAAAFTAGEVDNLMVGRNGVFVDRAGRDWEATITKLVDNPISIRQAFWAPYKKVIRIIEERVAKRAAEADAAASAKLEQAAPAASAAPAAPAAPAAAKPAEPEPHRFDVGTIAALGVAIGGIGAFATAILATIFGLGWWMPLGIIGLILAISAPSMLLAFMKLRRRNLGPLLDANGWAINALTRINIPFGTALTELAALPPGARRSTDDPYADRRRPWRFYVAVLVVAVLAFAWYLGKLDRYLPGPVRSTAVLGSSAPAYVAPDGPTKPDGKTDAKPDGKTDAKK